MIRLFLRGRDVVSSVYDFVVCVHDFVSSPEPHAKRLHFPRWISIVFLVPLLVLCTVHPVWANGSWVSIGPDGGHVHDTQIDPSNPDTIYAGTRGGVFKSTDAGGTWTVMNNGLTCLNVQTLAVDPTDSDTVYAGMGPYSSACGGVFKSTCGGCSWTLKDNGLPSSPNVRDLAVDPTSHNTIYAATYGNGIFKSTDGGDSWSAINNGLGTLNIERLSFDRATPISSMRPPSGPPSKSCSRAPTAAAVGAPSVSLP
jgi:hypothetical protein